LELDLAEHLTPMPAFLDIALNVTLITFMVGSLLEMGLKLKLIEAAKALRDLRFLGWSLVWCFVFSPALALVLTRIIPLEPPFALGMILLGLAPCAPFLPKVAETAGGSLPYVAAFMLLAFGGTVILMPLAVPVLATGFFADAWTIAKPLLFFIVAPFVIGIAVRAAAEDFAELAHPIVKMATNVDIIALLGVALVMYGRDMLSAIGTYAIGTQAVYYGICAVAAYGLGFGLPHGQKSVIALGLATRNVGAALAPLLAVPGTDKRAIVMCILATFVTIAAGFGGARVLARFAPPAPGLRLGDGQPSAPSK
jgi:bile acid:Na+ symporter, BASS family